mgnify:CR=1 FL=1
MSFKMLTGKKLDSMLDQLSAKDVKEIRAQFELDVQKENQKEIRAHFELNVQKEN